MKRFALLVLSVTLVLGAAGWSYAADLSSSGLEEAFVDAVGTCGPTSNVAGALGKSDDPAVVRALRQALIIEAADDAAGVASQNKPHADCMKKELTGRGYTTDQLGVLPDCTKTDWPDPLTSLGSCVKTRARMMAGMKSK
ncbi:MAG TPA: hypothetical protein VIX59_16035 [Candidatus Binataceae bacterium]